MQTPLPCPSGTSWVPLILIKFAKEILVSYNFKDIWQVLLVIPIIPTLSKSHFLVLSKTLCYVRRLTDSWAHRGAESSPSWPNRRQKDLLQRPLRKNKTILITQPELAGPTWRFMNKTRTLKNEIKKISEAKWSKRASTVDKALSCALTLWLTNPETIRGH